MSHAGILTDIRRIGPNSDRDISAVCSACGTTLLAQLNSTAQPDSDKLLTELEMVFEKHLTQSS